MNDADKLNLILNKLQIIEPNLEEQKLQELSHKYWGFTQDDIKLLKLTKSLLDHSKSDKSALTLSMDLHHLANSHSEDNIKKTLDRLMEESKSQ